MLHEPKLTNVVLPYCRRAVKTSSPNPHGETCLFIVSSSESEHDSAGATHAQRMQCADWPASQ